MGSLKNHPGMWLRDDAANAINALEDKYGVIVINRAGQTEADQQRMIDKWDRGDRAGMYEPKRPARLSTHVMNGGEAVDVYNYTSDRAKLEEFGFEWYGTTDPVHYTFRGWDGVVNDMGTIDDNEHNQIVIGKAIQRALRFDVRPNGYGANWQLGPTIWERLNQIEAAAKLGSTVDFTEDDAKLVAAAIPTSLAEKVIDALKARL